MACFESAQPLNSKRGAGIVAFSTVPLSCGNCMSLFILLLAMAGPIPVPLARGSWSCARCSPIPARSSWTKLCPRPWLRLTWALAAGELCQSLSWIKISSQVSIRGAGGCLEPCAHRPSPTQQAFRLAIAFNQVNGCNCLASPRSVLGGLNSLDAGQIRRTPPLRFPGPVPLWKWFAR